MMLWAPLRIDGTHINVEERTHAAGRGQGEKIALIILLGLLVGSFVYGWYFDPSTATAKENWADQSLYATAAGDLARGDLPSRGALHFQMLYPMMGALGSLFNPSDPFMPVSLSLLLGSAAFIYAAARRILGWGWAVAMVALVFSWDLQGGTFNYPSELFVIPWNNQVVFFSMAYFFWLLTAKSASDRGSVSPWLYLASGLVTGVTIGAREETALFLIPLLVWFLFKSGATSRMWGLALLFMVAGYLPHLIVKTMVLGDAANTGRPSSYLETLRRYMSWDRLSDNVLDVLVNSSARGVEAGRVALLEAAPWLWVSPLGLALYMFNRNQKQSIKGFLVLSVAFFLFYLAGENMALEELKFHCIRYVSPALIAMNFGTIYALVWGWRRLRPDTEASRDLARAAE